MQTLTSTYSYTTDTSIPHTPLYYTHIYTHLYITHTLTLYKCLSHTHTHRHILTTYILIFPSTFLRYRYYGYTHVYIYPYNTHPYYHKYNIHAMTREHTNT